MSRAERLQAAVEKLERLRSEAFPGTWEILTSGVEGGDHWYVTADKGAILYVTANDGSDEEPREPTVALVTNLPRTLAAQLAVLAYGLTLTGPIPASIVALADAILGGDS